MVARRLLIDPGDAGNVQELKARLKVRFHQVVGVLHLALGPWVACLIDHSIDLQAAQQGLEGPADTSAAWVHHQVVRHAVHLLLGALLNGCQEGFSHVDDGLATGHIVDKDGA